MTDLNLQAAIYNACLKSALAMKGDLKTLSWFGKNHRRKTVAAVQEQKKAA